jgi:LuxR family maltose regulon positive regulatory protein
MTTALLQTKFYIPAQRPYHVARPQLVERLEAGLAQGCSLTLISAPAGYGKSTLLVEWIQASGMPVAWLTLDGNDNEPARFLAYLVASLQQIFPELGQAVSSRLQRSELPVLSSLMTLLINDLSRERSGQEEDDGRFLLVLDDFQSILAPTVLEAVDFLLAQQPPQMHVAILSRQDPALSLSRIRGRGLVSELRQNDLRFSLEESSTFLVRAMGLDPSQEEIATLADRTEGWIAGLQLAALSMQGLDPVERSRFIARFSGRYHFILDYLTDEVLRRQPESRQRFLLQTAILDQMSGPLCDAVLGLGTSRTGEQAGEMQSLAILEELDHGNLFLVPLDDERHWYRYHKLFVELLRARLQETWPDRVPELHRRAATWYEKNGFMAAAVNHSMLCGDMAEAAEVVQRAITSFDTWSQVEVASLLGWLEALPPEVRQNRPWLRLFYARATYLTGQPEASRKAQEELEEWLATNPDAAGARQVAGLVRADRTSYAVVGGDVRESIVYAQSALEHLPEEEAISRMRAYAILGLAQSRAGDILVAQQAFTRAIEMAQEMGVPLATVPLLCNLAENHIMAGELGQAEQLGRRAVELGTVEGRQLAVVGYGHLEVGKVLYQRNDLEAAEKHHATALRLLSQGGITESFGNVHGELAVTRQALGKPAEALAVAQEGVRVARESRIGRLLVLAQAFRARVWLAQGDLDSAVAWARTYQELGATEYLREVEELALARVMIASGKPGEAIPLLEKLLGAAGAAGRYSRVLEAGVLLALATQAQGDTGKALDFLGRSLELAEPEGYVRVYLDEGFRMAELLRSAARQNLSPAYVTRLLAAFEGLTTKPVQEIPRGQPPVYVEPLTDREEDVLRLLAEGLSNKEIAGRLYLSPNTVRSHTYNLYSKLAVHSRLQAVTRARELGLLASNDS